MRVVFEAPFELPTAAVFLPSPTFGDNLSPLLGLNQKVSINNRRYTYVKRKNRTKLNYTFILTLKKSFELETFIDLFTTNYIKMTNHKDEVWRIRFTSEPFTYTSKTRDERVEINLVMEGTLINGSVINC